MNTRREATQMVTAAKLTRLTHKIAIQLHLVAESWGLSRRPVRKLLDTPSYVLPLGQETRFHHCSKKPEYYTSRFLSPGVTLAK
jgi:hypothetical protein